MPIKCSVEQGGGVSKKLLKERLVTMRRKAPPLLELLLMVFLPLKLNKGVIGMSTKNLHEQKNNEDPCKKNDEEWCFLSVLSEERTGEDPEKLWNQMC